MTRASGIAFGSPDGGRRAARRPLWPQYSTAAESRDGVTVVRAEGCRFWDREGREYLDALAGLHSVNIGYGPWPEMADVARRQVATLPFFPNWFGYANEPALALADRLRALAPIEVGQVFLTQSGSEAIEAALKLARQFHRLNGEPERQKFVTRRGAYHGMTGGALALTGVPALRNAFEPLSPQAIRVAPPYPFRCNYCRPAGACTLQCAEEIESAIVSEGPHSVAAVVLEPVQNSGGSLTPPDGYPERVREICDRHGVLLIADETITSFGRIGEWFASSRHRFAPDVITTAKGLTSSYAPLGAMIVSAPVSAPFFAEPERIFRHGSTFGGHPLSAALALANIEIIERERLLDRVNRLAPGFRARCEALQADQRHVAEVRGEGLFWSLELVPGPGRTFEPARRTAIAGRLAARARSLGLHMKFDDRVQLAAQFTPALVATEQLLDEMLERFGRVLADAVAAGELDR